MKIGSTKRVLINFNTSILTDLDDAAIVSLEAYLFVGKLPLLKFKKGGGVGFDGDIEKDTVQYNVGIIKLTNALSLRLIPGKLKMEVWLVKTVSGIPEHYAFTVDVTVLELPIK
jgi:hypothetical protein